MKSSKVKINEAIKDETSGNKFYTGLSKQLHSKKDKATIKQMANDEANHKKKLIKMKNKR